MKRTSLAKTETQFLSLVAILVALFALPVIGSFQKESEPTVIVKKPNVEDDKERSPASQESTESPPAPAAASRPQDSKTSSINYECGDELATGDKTVESAYVRIVGANCSEKDPLEITNASNGFSASVIYSKGAKFSTDFIDLKEGMNEFKITATLGNGSQITKTLHITRRSPATAELRSGGKTTSIEENSQIKTQSY